MLIEEIEAAEQSAEEIISSAKGKALARIGNARAASFESLVEKARAEGDAIQRNAESEARFEAKKITASKAKFSLPREATRKLAEDIANRVLKAAGKDVLL